MYFNDFSDLLTFPSGATFFVFNEISTTIGWIAMKFGTCIHSPQRANCIDFGPLETS